MTKKFAFSLLILATMFLVALTVNNAKASHTEVGGEPAPVQQVVDSIGFYNDPLIQFDPPPPSGDCDQDDPGAKMKCQYQKLSDSICETNQVIQDSTISFLENKKEKVQHYCASTQAWIDAPGREDQFKNSFKKKDTDCYIEEIIGDLDDKGNPIGDDDGICTKNEQNKDGCVEDDTDGIGNDNGFCEVTRTGPGKKVREPCLEVCEVEDTGNPNDDENLDVEMMEMVGGALEVATEDMDTYNSALRGMIQEWEDVSIGLTNMNAANTYEPDKCLGLLLYSVDPYSEIVQSKVKPINYTRTDRPFSYEDLDFHRTNANYTAILGQVCENAFSYSWSFGVGGETGGSTQAWCSIFHGIDDIVKDLGDGVEMLDDAITGTRLDNAVQCLEYVAKNIKGTQGSLDYKVEWRRIHLQVIELKEKQEFLVYATEYGRSDHLMVEEYHLHVSTKDWLGFDEITANSTWTEVEPGIYLVQVNLPKELRNADLFWFEVSHVEQMQDQQGVSVLDDAGNPISVEHSGSVIFDSSNQGLGQ